MTTTCPKNQRLFSSYLFSKSHVPLKEKGVIVEVKRRAVVVDMLCPKCQKGFLIANGIVLPTIEPKHGHSCNRCDNKAFLPKHYPVVLPALQEAK